MSGQNNQQPSSSGRLPTIRQSLDLNLGPPKKTFVPNLNAKKKVSTEAKPTKPEDSGKKEHKHSFSFERKTQQHRGSDNQHHHRPFKKPEYVQSESMFAQGVGVAKDANKTSLSSLGSLSRTPSSQGGESSSTPRDAPSPLLTNKSHPGLTFKKEPDSSDGFIADLKSGLYPPVKLPFDSLNSKTKPTQTASDEPASVEDFFFGPGSSGRLFSVQLPRVLPSPAAATHTMTSSTPQGSQVPDPSGDTPESERPAMDLSTFPEGLIGKLQLLRNGQLRLVIGECHFDVNYGFSHPHLTDLAVCTPPQSEDGVGELSVLGHVTDKVIVRPRVEDLIRAKLRRQPRSTRQHSSSSSSPQPDEAMDTS